MAGYAKIWTSIFNDPWFLGLSATARGVWLQLLVWAKMVGDTGSVSGRSWAAMGSAWGCDGKTCRKFLRKFRDDGKISFTEDEQSGITIVVANYQYYQKVTAKELSLQTPSKPRKSPENSRKIPPKPEQSRAKQTKPDGVGGKNPDHQRVVDHWYEKYLDRVGEKYDFKGQDWGNLKRLLTVWGGDKLILLIDQLFVTQDQFIQKAGFSIGILSSQSNKLAQELATKGKAEHGPTGPTTI